MMFVNLRNNVHLILVMLWTSLELVILGCCDGMGLRLGIIIHRLLTFMGLMAHGRHGWHPSRDRGCGRWWGVMCDVVV